MLQALLETSAQCPQNEIRLAAQKTLEPLTLKAEVLSPLLQPPSLGPLTPTPTAKRAKTGKEARSPQLSQIAKATQGKSLFELTGAFTVLISQLHYSKLARPAFIANSVSGNGWNLLKSWASW